MATDSNGRKTVVLGEEHDAALREVLRQVLSELGAAVVDTSWGIGGSQEVETIALTLDGKTLTVEAETYIGLSMTGEPELVERIAGEVRARTEAGRAARNE